MLFGLVFQLIAFKFQRNIFLKILKNNETCFLLQIKVLKIIFKAAKSVRRFFLQCF